MKKKCYIYGHYTEDTDELFYIGKGTGKRAWAKSGRSKYWNNKVNKDGLVVKILEEHLTDEQAYEREKQLIAEAGLENLVNFLEGGYGMTSADAFRIQRDPEYRKKMDKVYQGPEWRRKTAEANKLKSQDPKWRRKVSEGVNRRSQDPEWRRKMAEAGKCRSQDLEWRRKMAEAGKCRSQDPEWRRKTAEAGKRLAQDPEWRRKMAEGVKRRSQDPEWRRNVAEGANRRWQDPEYRRKVSEGVKQYHANKKKEMLNQNAEEFFSF